MIAVTLNGEEKFLPKGNNLQQAIEYWQMESQSFAVAINQQFIPRANYAETPLKEGDRVELLVPMQGG